MKTFENHTNDLIEKKFIKLIHPYDLDIKFDFIEYTGHLFHFYDDAFQFTIHKKSNKLYMNELLFAKIKPFNDLMTLFPELIEYYFNIKYNELLTSTVYHSNNVSIHFDK